jgi:hypothetical protein
MAKRVDHAGVAAILAERGIVGMIEGRTEVGPRALGHRSLLAYPASNEVKDKLNQLKVRQWYRPSAREQNKAKRSERARAQTTDRAGARAGRGGGPRRRRFRAYRSSSFAECGGLWRFVATNARAWVCNTARHVATQRDTLQHSATRCSTARHVATQCVAAEAVGRWTLLAPV